MMPRKHADYDWTPLDGITPVKVGRGYSTFTADEQRRIRAFYFASGAPARLIAEHLGVTPFVIYRIYSSKDVSNARPVLLTLSDKDIRQLHKRHLKGVPVTILATEIGCHVESLRSRMRRMNLPIRNTRDAFLERKDAVAVRLRRGMTSKAIRAELGVGKKLMDSAIRSIQRDAERAQP